jgi:hypothetical protein
MAFKRFFAGVLFLGLSLHAMSEREQGAFGVIQSMVQRLTDTFDATQSAEKQWEFFRNIIKCLSGHKAELLGKDLLAGAALDEALERRIIMPLARKFIGTIVQLHKKLGKEFFKDPEQADFSLRLTAYWISLEYRRQVEAMTTAKDWMAAKQKMVRWLVAYAVAARAVGIRIRDIRPMFDALKTGGQGETEDMVQFIHLIFAPLQQNKLIGDEECGEIVYTYAELDDLVACANDQKLRAYVDSLTAFRVR